MKKHHNKLVRDRIPEIIQATNQPYAIKEMSLEEYKLALRTKLLEEAKEVAEADNMSELQKELADIYEVIDALIKLHALDKSTILKLQTKKRNSRGGFTRRLKLLWVEKKSTTLEEEI